MKIILLVKNKLMLSICLFLVGGSLMAQSGYQWKTSSSGDYAYKYVTNDPSKSRFYTLKNALTVVLSQNAKEPVIGFRLAERAGSNTDPKKCYRTSTFPGTLNVQGNRQIRYPGL